MHTTSEKTYLLEQPVSFVFDVVDIKCRAKMMLKHECQNLGASFNNALCVARRPWSIGQSLPNLLQTYTN